MCINHHIFDDLLWMLQEKGKYKLRNEKKKRVQSNDLMPFRCYVPSVHENIVDYIYLKTLSKINTMVKGGGRLSIFCFFSEKKHGIYKLKTEINLVMWMCLYYAHNTYKHIRTYAHIYIYVYIFA